MQTQIERPASRKTLPIAPAQWLPRLIIGAALNAVAWVSAWARVGPLAHYSFFPLWLGFILIVDALTEARSGTSLWRRSQRRAIASKSIAPYIRRSDESFTDESYAPPFPSDPQGPKSPFRGAIRGRSGNEMTVKRPIFLRNVGENRLEFRCDCPGSQRAFVALFVVSAPFWWYFERLNRYVGNWHYLTPHHYSAAAYIFWASLAFSTVIPAVLSVAELLGAFGGGAHAVRPLARLSVRAAIAVIAVGVGTLALSLIFPHQCFPFLWLSLLLILDPINNRGGEPSIIGLFRARSFARLARLMAAGLICGFFWEMWNYWSLPKWYYTVPYVGFGKVFEMPILGYSGYLPFALEIFVVYHFARLVTRRFGLFPPDYVRI